MAATFLAQFAAASDSGFQQRVAAAIAAVAVAVYGEVSTTPGHAARAAYAVQLINNPPLGMVTVNQLGVQQPDKSVYGIARLLAAQGLDATSTDAAIQAQISNDWSALAGA